MEISFSLDDINDAAVSLWEYAKANKVWAFYGEMGAGKTTFIHALGEALDVSSVVGSPTYSIINEYKSDKGDLIYHMDFYRLKSEEEALQAGVEDCLYSGNLCLVEWPEKAESLLPEDALKLTIEVIDFNTRKIKFE